MIFSIVVPVYKVEKYILKCIESIVGQTFDDFQIIIIDDESPDKSIQIVKDNFDDSRIKIYQKKNGGLSSARNYGLKFAEGEYIWFIDSDDYLIDELALQKIYNTIISHQHPEIIVFNNKVVFEEDPTKGWINRNAPENTKALIGYEYIGKYKVLPINAWTQCYRSDFFLDNNFRFADGMYFEDIYLNLDIYLKVKTVIGIDECLINYVKRENSIMTARFNMRHLNSEIDVILKFNELLKKKSFSIFYLKDRIHYEYNFLKKIYNSCEAEASWLTLNFSIKKLKNIVIPSLETESKSDKLEKKVFQYFPHFVLQNQKNFLLLNRIEGKIIRLIPKRGRKTIGV